MLINRCGGGSGSSVYETLPPQVTGFSATAGNAQVVLNWINPTSSYFTGIVIVRKAGSAPTKVTDGTKVYDGTGATCTDTGLTNGTTYYWRTFPYNSKKQFNTDITGATVSATPQPGQAISNLPIGAIVDIPLNGVSCPHYVMAQNHSGYPANSTSLVPVNTQGTMAFGTTTKYSNSSYRTYLNSDYLSKLPAAVQSKILTTTVTAVASSSQDKVFPMSYTETNNYLTDGVYFGDSVHTLIKSDQTYWLRSFNASNQILCINTSGMGMETNISTPTGIRPLFNLDNTVNVSLQPNASGYYTLM